MIRQIKESDYNIVNELLSEFNVKIESLKGDFCHVIVYEDIDIKGIMVYDLIYDRAEIEYIYVRKDSRNKGIATSLLRYLEQFDIDNITLEVRESNERAISFYRKNGFEIISTRKNYYKEENGLLMMKKLGE